MFHPFPVELGTEYSNLPVTVKNAVTSSKSATLDFHLKFIQEKTFLQVHWYPDTFSRAILSGGELREPTDLCDGISLR